MTDVSQDMSNDVDHALICFLGIYDTDEFLSHIKEIEQGKVPQTPYCHVTCPSIFDPIQAPKGFHTGRLESPVPYNSDWDKMKDDYANKCLSIWMDYAPNIKLVHTYIYPPTYIEKKLKDMVRGSFKQGAYTPLQMGYFRPNESCSQIRTPIEGLYVCGASVYPGGMIIAGPGYVGANVIAQDMGVKKNWEEPEFVRHAREAGLIE
jgi:phytoene dehydrogenase-like protein